MFVYDTATAHFRNYNSRNSGLNNDNVHAVCIDDRKNLWVGNFYGGLNRMRPGDSAFNRSGTSTVTPSNSVYSLLQDGAGNLWAGTFYDGLFRYDYASERFERFEPVPSWVFVWDILEDYKGNIWLACYGEGSSNSTVRAITSPCTSRPKPANTSRCANWPTDASSQAPKRKG